MLKMYVQYLNRKGCAICMDIRTYMLSVFTACMFVGRCRCAVHIEESGPEARETDINSRPKRATLATERTLFKVSCTSIDMNKKSPPWWWMYHVSIRALYQLRTYAAVLPTWCDFEADCRFWHEPTREESAEPLSSRKIQGVYRGGEWGRKSALRPWTWVTREKMI